MLSIVIIKLHKKLGRLSLRQTSNLKNIFSIEQNDVSSLSLYCGRRIYQYKLRRHCEILIYINRFPFTLIYFFIYIHTVFVIRQRAIYFLKREGSKVTIMYMIYFSSSLFTVLIYAPTAAVYILCLVVMLSRAPIVKASCHKT